MTMHGYFSVFELKNKFHHLTLKDSIKQIIVRQLSSCLNEKYNGFHVVSNEYSRKLRTNVPVEVVKKFLTDLRLNVIIAANFLQEQISKNDTSKIAPASPV